MKKYLILGLGVPAVIIGILYSFRVLHISCRLQEQDCPSQLQNELSSLKGSSLFFTVFESEIPRAISNETMLVSAIEKRLPGTLVVYVTQEKPSYILRTPEKEYAVYTSGVAHELTENVSPNDYHIFELEFPLEKIMEQSHVRSDYHSQLTETSISLYNIPFSLQNSTWKDTQFIQFQLQSGVVVYLPTKSAGEKVEILKQILESSELETLPEQLTEIDLRYKYPVLRTTQ